MIRTTAALTILHLLNWASGSQEPDSFAVPPSCHPRDSCTPHRSEDEDHLWGNYTCECGPHCVRYGTCCGDSPHAGTTLHVERRGEKCGRLSPHFSEYFTLVSACSDRWRHDYRVRDECERRDASAEDPLSALPVTSAATGVTYRNHFCATCNFDARDFRMWDALLIQEAGEDSDFLTNATEGDLLESLSYDRDRQSWGVSADGRSFLEVRLLFKVPPVLRKAVKKCYPHVVSDCDESHASDYGLRYKCLSYYSPVKVKTDGKRAVKKYRNVHCAVCNNVPSGTDFTCMVDVQRRKRPSFSFAHLIDVNGDVAVRRERCGPNRMWDPFSKKCRSLACALPGYVIKDGKCVGSS